MKTIRELICKIPGFWGNSANFEQVFAAGQVGVFSACRSAIVKSFMICFQVGQFTCFRISAWDQGAFSPFIYTVLIVWIMLGHLTQRANSAWVSVELNTLLRALDEIRSSFIHLWSVRFSFSGA
ncbi:unnamed protein product [Protopolystoma xenopodis]|uniref:Uncharacterized protein n=1 Tax=Protopolystoma xenopodis TaxID=117903 RepID=A0A448XEG2_9PLAT|nr:unnamed protein product [Protopolystoma xenopodis]